MHGVDNVCAIHHNYNNCQIIASETAKDPISQSIITISEAISQAFAFFKLKDEKDSLMYPVS